MTDQPSHGPTSHRKTCKRYNLPGHAHALTFSCFRRRAFLGNDRTRLWFTEAVERARDKYRFHVWAFVIMPEHVHLLLWPTAMEYDISQILSSIKLSVVKRSLVFIRREAPGFLPKMEDRQPNGHVHYRFWQRGGGYDRNIVEPVTAYQRIEYLHANPVRRGFCKSPRIGYGQVRQILPAFALDPSGLTVNRCRQWETSREMMPSHACANATGMAPRRTT